MTMPIPDGSVVITPAQMYQMQGETAKKVDDLAAEVRALRGDVNPALADVRHDLSDHETRIRVLESVRWKAAGGIALLSSLIASGVVAAVLEATRR